MKTEFRNRAFLPVVLPLAILAVIGVLVIGFAMILLWNTREAALVLASVAAAGVLIAISLAASQDRLDSFKGTAVALAGVLPVIAGLLFAVGLFVDVDDSELNINRLPHGPEADLVIGADDPITFDATMMVVPADEDVTVEFDNRNTGVPHNWVLFTDDTLTEELASSGDPAPGPDTQVVTFQVGEGTYTFICIVHPNMIGELVAEAGAEPSIS
ncbi:MAG: plastocyanin/azurin family copper-binding protein [Nitriliruptorales bacterium]|nr:plastocyanin/azurin family copper-binding protein [Nitriliruptorales bacterium]